MYYRRKETNNFIYNLEFTSTTDMQTKKQTQKYHKIAIERLIAL